LQSRSVIATRSPALKPFGATSFCPEVRTTERTLVLSVLLERA